MAARNKVFTTTELLEAVLCRASPPDILVASRVCSKWAWLVHKSPRIATKLLGGSFVEKDNDYPDPRSLYYFSVTTNEKNKRLIIFRNHTLKLENYILADASTKRLLFLTHDDTTMGIDPTYNLTFKKCRDGKVICRTKAVGSFGQVNSREVWWSDRCLKDYVSRRLLKIW